MLFGSRATGKARPDSDVDLAVIAPDEDLAQLAGDLSAALGQEVEIVSLADPPYPLLKRIVREGIAAFEGSRGAEAHWRTRALLILDTDQAWYERMRESYLERMANGAGAHGGR
jgi:hypothetical protein